MRGFVLGAGGGFLAALVAAGCGGTTVGSAAGGGSGGKSAASGGSGGKSAASGGSGGDQVASGGGRSPGSSGQGGMHTVNVFIDTLAAGTGGCVPRVLTVDPQTGKIPCAIVEAVAQGSGRCDPARGRVAPELSLLNPALEELKQQGQCDVPAGPACATFTVCQIEEAGSPCHQAGVAEPLAGWCYVDPSQDPSDDPSLVASCPANAQRRLRFVDPANATPAPGAVVMIACFGATLNDPGSGGAS